MMVESERWYEIVGYFDPNKKEEISSGGVRVIVRGDIDNVVVVQVPNTLTEDDAHRVMQSVQATMEGGGVDRPLILMPDHIRFMKVRRLSTKETANLKKLSAPRAKPPGTVH